MKSYGLVTTQQATFFDTGEKFSLECGKELAPIQIAYETYGKLNAQKTNAVFICHALSGDAHAAGFHSHDDRKPGWWDIMIGPGKAFDTDTYFVICANILGGCKGTTGPSSVNPETGEPYGLRFPFVTIQDMVRLHKVLLDHLGIKQLLSVAGGSIGGMQVLQWAVSFPDMCYSYIPIATGARLSTQGIAFNEVGRHAIISDPYWNNGDYYTQEKQPSVGLAIARMVGHITYLSEGLMDRKFGRTLRHGDEPQYYFQSEFSVETYLQYKGLSFVKRFDANSYLHITRAMDYFDLPAKYRTLEDAFQNTEGKFLLISFSSDWLFPTVASKEIVNALIHIAKEASFVEISCDYGHDAFLLEIEHQTRSISAFLENTYAGIQ